MIMNSNTIGYGMGWRWEKLDDMYQAPTVSFRINRKGVGVDFEGECSSLREGMIGFGFLVISLSPVHVTRMTNSFSHSWGYGCAEYEDDINKSPSMFFYQGTFSDPEFRRIDGVIQRNRDLVQIPGQPRVMVNVGTFQMSKVD